MTANTALFSRRFARTCSGSSSPSGSSRYHYGLDFNVGIDTYPVIGKHDKEDKFVIASDPESRKPPYICAEPPPFLTTKGREYFYFPSLTALCMIAMGFIDPT